MDIQLSAQEQIALQKLAFQQKRKPRDQAAIIVVRELERAGLLTAETPSKALAEMEPANGHAK